MAPVEDRVKEMGTDSEADFMIWKVGERWEPELTCLKC